MSRGVSEHILQFRESGDLVVYKDAINVRQSMHSPHLVIHITPAKAYYLPIAESRHYRA